jgi:hypothetical protein
MLSANQPDHIIICQGLTGVNIGLPLSMIWTVSNFKVLSPITLNAPCGTSRTFIDAVPAASVTGFPSGVSRDAPGSVPGGMLGIASA